MKLTKEILESHVVEESYHQFPNTTVTVCCLTLDNGFDVIGYSTCIDKETFNAESGEKHAKANAVGEMWELYSFDARQKQKEANDG